MRNEKHYLKNCIYVENQKFIYKKFHAPVVIGDNSKFVKCKFHWIPTLVKGKNVTFKDCAWTPEEW